VPASHALVAHQFDDAEQQRQAESLGMWVFLATEVLIFGALFAGYAAYRLLYPHDFEAASSKLNLLIGAINTVVLLTSSLTMALSVYAAHTDHQRLLVRCLAMTAALGALFMVFKVIEYYTDYRDQLVPVLAFDATEWAEPGHVQLFLMFYYIMTGLHALHLTIGIGVMIWVIVLARRGRFGPQHYSPVEVAGLYWHFIDVIWIFLLPLLYLTGTHSWHELHF
jgi:cytochrome c oxidase subunit III